MSSSWGEEVTPNGVHRAKNTVLMYGNRKRKHEEKASASAVRLARRDAVAKHGPLTLRDESGFSRWSSHVQEEATEVADELMTLHAWRSGAAALESRDAYIETVERAINELAQLAQLAMGMIDILAQELDVKKEKVSFHAKG